MFDIIYHHPDGVTTTVVETGLEEDEAADIAQYLNELRNPAEFLDGTYYDVQLTPIDSNPDTL